MRTGWRGRGWGFVIGALVASMLVSGAAEAARHSAPGRFTHRAESGHGFSRVSQRFGHGWHPSWQRSALQCVPFARENSGIELSGNAGTWWNNASGLYERGARPEVGSILNFRATGHMHMGHVAVVTNVISPRHIEIDHANWGAPGRISRNIDVVDVSEGNDWTAVRVALSQAEDYGSTYPTYGFIYDRPDRGIMVANDAVTHAPASNVHLAQAAATAPEEVAEAASDEDDGPSAPRYSGRHRSRSTIRASGHVSAARNQRGIEYPSASTYRVSAHNGLAKPISHKAGRRHL